MASARRGMPRRALFRPGTPARPPSTPSTPSTPPCSASTSPRPRQSWPRSSPLTSPASRPAKPADAYAQLGQPVLVDDTGLAVHAWNGLPGALVAWFLDTVGLQGILDMAAGITDRRATATSALGYADATGARVFQGTMDGTLATEPRGTSGFGYDPRLRPRRRHRPSHLGGDDRRGEGQGLPPQARRRGNAQRPWTPVTSPEGRRGALPELSAAVPDRPSRC